VDAILIDDRRGIREAINLGLNTSTTFALFELAAIKGLVDFEETINQLAATSFHMPPMDIVDAFLIRNRKT